MKILLQRCLHGSVMVDGQTIGAIDQGLVLLIGIEKHDTEEILIKMAEKTLAYRVFSDADGKMNLNVKEINGGVLAVSQFTLAADTTKGLRPGFSRAAPPSEAEKAYNRFVNLLHERHAQVATGKFGADMKVSLVNDGPVTFMLNA